MTGRKITLTGDLGSGKSAVSKLIAARTGFSYRSTGAAQRELAERYGISTYELNKRTETDTAIDDQIDDISRKLNDAPGNFIIDSRLAWHFVPSSFKVKLTVSPDVAAERVMKDGTRHSETFTDQESTLESLRARRQSEVQRFKSYYGVDLEDKSNYDAVIDTTFAAPEAVCDLILELADLYWDGKPFVRDWPMTPGLKEKSNAR